MSGHCSLPVLLLVLLSAGAAHAGMMGWLFAGDPPEPSSAGPLTASGEDGARQVPFEVRSADEKFMAAVKKTSELELSELDVCQHKVRPNGGAGFGVRLLMSGCFWVFR